MTIKAQPEDRDDGNQVIADVRAARHRISQRFGHDPYKLVAHYIERQKSHLDRLILAPDGEQDKSAA
jgi:hypothetical protein